MADLNRRFGELVRSTLERHRLSPREVQARANGRISFHTVSEMRRGVVPRAELIVEFALALDEDPTYWLKLAGKSLRWDPRSLEELYGETSAGPKPTLAAA